MIKFIISSTLLFISTLSFGQKNIILTKYPQKIPVGKKWVLPLNKSLLIKVNEGTLNIGTLCSAKFLTKIPSISAIVEGDFGKPNKVYGVNFKNLSKVAYTNDVTFSITPTSFSSYDYLNSQQGIIQSNQNIIFYQGQTVYITECFESLQLIEYTLTQNEIAQLKQKEKEKRELELKQKKEQAVQLAKEQEEETSSNIQNNAPLRLDELDNKPFLVRTDSLDLKGEILKLPFNRNNTYFNIKIDTSGKMTGILIDFISSGNPRQPDSIAYKFRTTNFNNDKELATLKFFTSHFKVSEVGLAKQKNKKVKVNFILPIQLVYYGGKMYLRLSYFYDESKEYSFDQTY